MSLLLQSLAQDTPASDDDGSTSMTSNGAVLHDLCYALAAAYALIAAWSLRKFILLSLVSRSWTQQRAIHILVLLCALCRAVFFSFAPRWSSFYSYVRMTSTGPDNALPVGAAWLYVLDEVPSLGLVAMLSFQLLQWLRSYYSFTHEPAAYLSWKRGLLLAHGGIITAQVGIWIAYGAAPASAELLSLLQACMYASAFVTIAVCMCVYGIRVTLKFASVTVGLNKRTRTQRDVLVVSICVCGAMLMRAAALVSTAVAAAAHVNDFETNKSPSAIAVTAIVFILLEICPLALILRYNRRVTGATGDSAASTQCCSRWRLTRVSRSAPVSSSTEITSLLSRASSSNDIDTQVLIRPDTPVAAVASALAHVRDERTLSRGSIQLYTQATEEDEDEPQASPR